MTLKRKKRFRELHRGLNEQELNELELSIKLDGLREPIVVWGDTIIDGDHREQICKRLGIEPKVIVKQFTCDDEAEMWILRHQLARRNLSPADFKAAIGKLYNLVKSKRGGDKKSQNYRENKEKSKDQNDTSAALAEEHGVSPATVKRAGKRQENLDKLPKGVKDAISANPKLASDKAVAKLTDKTVGEIRELGREVRVGQKPTFDAALGLKPSPNGKPAKGKATQSAAGLVDQLLKHFAGASGLVQGIDKVAERNGGKGLWYKQANESCSKLIEALGEMRKGKK